MGTKRSPTLTEDLTWYLEKIRTKGWLPNFYCSVAHLLSVEAKFFAAYGGWAWVEVDGYTFLPPVPYHPRPTKVPPINIIYTDLGGWEPYPGWVSEDWDWEYIYDPVAFRDMSGGKWEIFRKNTRKWPKRNGEAILVPFSTRYKEDSLKLAGEWLEAHEEGFHDPESLVSYLFSGNANVKVLVKEANPEVVLGLVGWDRNYEYTNFRYVLSRPGEAFLDEYTRLLFYTDREIHRGLLVNDGGTLDNPNLERFKDKLNPISKRRVKTWRRMDNGS